MDTNELQHHGIKGMKWGVRRTDAQLGNASSKTKKKSFFKKNDVKGKEPEKKKDSKEDIAAKKTEILKSRSAKKIYENADLFTDAELQSAYNRLQLERNIAGLAPKEIKKGEKFVDSTIKWGRKINDVSSTGITMYNNIAKLRNTFSESGRSNPWPTIGGENKKKPSMVKKIISQPKKQSTEKTTTEKSATEKKEKPKPEKVHHEKTTSRTERARSKAESKSSSKQEREVWKGTVEPTEKKRKRNTNWSNVRTTHLLTDKNVKAGRDYVTALLEDKRRW